MYICLRREIFLCVYNVYLHLGYLVSLYTYQNVYRHLRSNIYKIMYGRNCVQTRIYIYIYIYMCVCVCVCVSVSVCVCICVCLCV